MSNFFKLKFLQQVFAIIFIALFALEVNAANANVRNKSQIISPDDDKIESLTKWNSKQGLQRFERSQYKNDFYQLVNFYQPQINPLYCAVASSVIVLNALKNGEIASQKELEINRPQSVGGGVVEFKSYSQLNFLNEQTNKIKDKEVIEFKKSIKIRGKEVFDAGISLADLKDILRKAYNLKVEMVYAKRNNSRSIENFRSDLKKYLVDDKNFIIANFNGEVLNAKVGGHMSPIAAYDEESDSVLILDVALHKENWYFVPLEKLYQAMNTKDDHKYRGYLIVSK